MNEQKDRSKTMSVMQHQVTESKKRKSEETDLQTIPKGIVHTGNKLQLNIDTG